jgi:hypothetical protein
VGKLLIKILATAVIPEILQSDNGGKFTARCIELMERHYPTIHIAKGHPRLHNLRVVLSEEMAHSKRHWISGYPKILVLVGLRSGRMWLMLR